jgi:hypothetical protein
MPLPYLKRLLRLRVAVIGPAGRARGERKNILEFAAGAYLSIKARTLKTSKKQKQEKKGNNVFNRPGTFDGIKAALIPG